jgi:16S rRNA (cytosine967-C5)-methyltransferase
LYGLDEAREFCETADEEAPRTVRVNTRVTTQDGLLRDLAKAGVPAEAHPIVPDACILGDAIPTRAHLFRDGHFYVQDAASMLPPHLLQPEPGQAVLDLCAAPGGKSTHLAELSGGNAAIVANELHANKVHLLRQNIERLGHANIPIVVADGAAPPFGPVFDRVLLDAPCTGLGTLRRHPELKWRVQPGDPARMAELQARLLRSAVALCKIDGVIVYSVCTFTPEETEGVIAPILGDLPVEPEDGPAWLNPWKIAPGIFRILPRKNRLDGYFLIRLRKRS